MTIGNGESSAICMWLEEIGSRVYVGGRGLLSVLPSEELPGESGLLERLAIRCRAKTALPVF